MFDGVENLKVFESVATLASDGARSGKFTFVFPATESFGGEVEFLSNFGDSVEFVICDL